MPLKIRTHQIVSPKANMYCITRKYVRGGEDLRGVRPGLWFSYNCCSDGKDGGGGEAGGGADCSPVHRIHSSSSHNTGEAEGVAGAGAGAGPGHHY